MIGINFNLHGLKTKAYYFEDNNESGIIFIYGEINITDTVNVRIHSACCFSEVFGSNDCDCREQMLNFIDLIKFKGKGILIYLFQEGRGQGLNIKFKGYSLSQKYGLDTFQAYEKLGVKQDVRNYIPAISVLKEITKTRNIILSTNNPQKIKTFKENGFNIERKSIIICNLSENAKNYLKCKQNKLNHLK